MSFTITKSTVSYLRNATVYMYMVYAFNEKLHFPLTAGNTEPPVLHTSL